MYVAALPVAKMLNSSLVVLNVAKNADHISYINKLTANMIQGLFGLPNMQIHLKSHTSWDLFPL